MAELNESKIKQESSSPTEPTEESGFSNYILPHSPSNTDNSSELDDLPQASDFLSVQIQEIPSLSRKVSSPNTPSASTMLANPVLISCLTSSIADDNSAATVKTPAKMPRKDLTLANRISLLDQIRSQPPNTSHRQLAEITGVPKSTIARVIQQESKLREEWALQAGQQRTTQKRKREGKNPDVAEALQQWFAIVSRRGMQVNGPMLKTKSEEFAKKLGHENFKATDGWLSRWKSRNGIKFKKPHSKSYSTDTEGAEQWDSTKLHDLLMKFCTDDIYSACETSLFFRDVLDDSPSYKHTTLSGSKKATDHVNVLCCSNISGKDKRKLVIIGKNAKPRCFNGLRMDSLPVLYYANKNARMTSDIFKQWLMNWDSELQQQKSRKILLLLDNSAAYPHLECLKNIQLEFPDASTTSLVQPMELGIIKKLKTLYRGRLVNYILYAIEENPVTSSSKGREVNARITILDVAQLLADSWREISSKAIQNCFTYCGFKNSDSEMPGAASAENEIILQLQMPPFRNYQQMLCIDNGIQCHNENEDCEKAIIEQIAAKHMEISQDEDSEEDNTPEPELVTNHDARKYIAELRRYLMQEGNEGSPLTALDVCADFIQLQSVTRIHHGALNKFLKNTP